MESHSTEHRPFDISSNEPVQREPLNTSCPIPEAGYSIELVLEHTEKGPSSLQFVVKNLLEFYVFDLQSFETRNISTETKTISINAVSRKLRSSFYLLVCFAIIREFFSKEIYPLMKTIQYNLIHGDIMYAVQLLFSNFIDDVQTSNRTKQTKYTSETQRSVKNGSKMEEETDNFQSVKLLNFREYVTEEMSPFLENKQIGPLITNTFSTHTIPEILKELSIFTTDMLFLLKDIKTRNATANEKCTYTLLLMSLRQIKEFSRAHMKYFYDGRWFSAVRLAFHHDFKNRKAADIFFADPKV